MNRKFGGTAAVVILAVAVGGAALAFKSPEAPTTRAADLEWLNGMQLAQEESKRTGKPILLLSMFGRIDEEMPCANARTMRAALFPTPEFKSLAEKDVVLAWEMVREVPTVTIEIEGRKIQRTVRGNAVIYLCNSEGKVLDAFPGQYTKEDFIPAIRDSLKESSGKDEEEIIAFHREKGTAFRARLIRSTMSKSGTESPTLALMSERAPGSPPMPQLKRSPRTLRSDFELAAAGVIDASLSPASAEDVMNDTIGSKPEMTPQERGELIRKYDSRNNMRNIRPIIHLWLGSGEKLPTPMEAREDVLKRILKVPFDDPNWGLAEIDIPGTPFPST